MQKWITMAVCIAIPLLVGLTSGFLTRHESNGPWYQALQKPSFNPPSWVFAPVWTTLYILMGVSLYLVFRTEASVLRTAALVAFAVQLTLNFFWSLLFFRYHLPGVAAIEIVVLLIAIVAMILLFFQVHPMAAYIQIPYLAWVAFATVLSITIYWLNRTA